MSSATATPTKRAGGTGAASPPAAHAHAHAHAHAPGTPPAATVAEAARPATVDYITSLVRGHHRFVCLGEASHGTADHYALRADLSLALLSGEGVEGGPFHAVVYESDWPPAFAANLWVRGFAGGSVGDALAPYRQSRFPTWMWANTTFASFCERLRALNETLPPHDRKGLYGFDIYSFASSMAALIGYFEGAGDEAAAAAARARYACFNEHGGGSAERYALSIARGARGCEAAALAQLVETMEGAREAAEAEARAAEAAVAAEGGRGGGRGGPGPASPSAAAVLARERRFDAVSNARAVAAGEFYYRAMTARSGRDSTWNARDASMALTVQAVEEHVRAGGVKSPRIIVWAHNSHLGRAAASEMSARRGETNVGQLLTQAAGREVLVIGQLTYAGTVAAARAWGRPVENRAVRPALPGSAEALLHEAVASEGAPPAFALDLRPDEGPANARVRALLAEPRRVRHVGVIYRSAPAWAEVPSHYQIACLAAPPAGEGEEAEGAEEAEEADAYGLFDVAVFQDVTTAVTPLDPPPGWDQVVQPDEAVVGDEE